MNSRIIIATVVGILNAGVILLCINIVPTYFFMLFNLLLIIYCVETRTGADWWWFIDFVGVLGAVAYLCFYGEIPLFFKASMWAFILGFSLNLIRKFTAKDVSPELYQKWFPKELKLWR